MDDDTPGGVADRHADQAAGQSPHLAALTGPSDRLPEITFCVPTYQRPSLVERAIRSIIEASDGVEGDVEIIVSDNSPQVSEAACRRALASWTGRSTYIGNEHDLGLVGNFNQCVARSSGAHVLFVCDDDRLLPGAASAILDAVARSGGDDRVLLFGVEAVDDADRVLRRQSFGREVALDPAEATRRLLSDDGFAWFPGVVVSRAAFDDVGPFSTEFGNATDTEMWVRLFSRYGVRCVPTTISAYSVHQDSATQLMVFDRAAVAALQAIFERARATGVVPLRALKRAESQYLHQFILGGAYLHLRTGDLAGARRVMDLFALPRVRALGPSAAWLPVRLLFSALSHSPVAIVHPLMRWADRAGVVRRVRAVTSPGRNRRQG